jgi:hypothetical protein
MMAVEVNFAAGAVGPMHNHPHEQLTYVLSGEFEFFAVVRQNAAGYAIAEVFKGGVFMENKHRAILLLTFHFSGRVFLFHEEWDKLSETTFHFNNRIARCLLSSRVVSLWKINIGRSCC